MEKYNFLPIYCKLIQLTDLCIFSANFVPKLVSNFVFPIYIELEKCEFHDGVPFFLQPAKWWCGQKISICFLIPLSSLAIAHQSSFIIELRACGCKLKASRACARSQIRPARKHNEELFFPHPTHAASFHYVCVRGALCHLFALSACPWRGFFLHS